MSRLHVVVVFLASALMMAALSVRAQVPATAPPTQPAPPAPAVQAPLPTPQPQPQPQPQQPPQPQPQPPQTPPQTLQPAVQLPAPPAVPPAALAAAGTERRVKAEFLYKFLGYTEFPATSFADATSPVQIGVAGPDDMLAELVRTVAGRTLNGRPIIVRAVREGDNPGLLHLLFVAGSDCAAVARVLRAVPGALLPVTECEGGLQAGSVINFKMVDDHVRFDVSLDAAEKNNVRLSSRLLNVASHVQKGNI